MSNLALGGASIDGGLYTWVTDLAQRAPHAVNVLVSYGTDHGLFLFAILMLICWWRARRGTAAEMARALAGPLVVTVAYLANDTIKALFDEARPCRTLHTVTVALCPGVTDWSFPSNHAAIAAAAAVALIACAPRLGRIAVPAALLMAFSRIWVGAHYPHDVLAGLAIGVVVARPLMPLARHATPAVARLRTTRLRPLVAAR